jgi:SAM-dependent methyltransferase
MAVGEWCELWRKLASHDLMTGSEGEERMVERWRALAERLDIGGEQRRDPILEFVLERLEPGMTVLDIGAGIGRWTLPLAERVRSVTAVEPVEGMRSVLRERLESRNVTNVSVVEETWFEAEVPRHDVAVAAYSMYTSADLPAFAWKMDASAARLCCMAMRLPAADGIIGELSRQIYGQWHDSPNFVVGYNALLEAGLTPNVFIEPAAVSYWTDPSLDAAGARARRHLRLGDDARFDDLIAKNLEQRLRPTETGYAWPDWMRSAVVWWEPAGSGASAGL